MGNSRYTFSNILFLTSIAVLLGSAVFLVAQKGFSVNLSYSRGLGLAITLYCISHVLRAVRLGVLIHAGQLRRLLTLYVYTAACSALIPFKLGELVRINELAWWTRSYWKGLLIVWIERGFDVAAVGTLALVTLTMGGQTPDEIKILLWIIVSFVLFTVLIFFVVPEQLRSLNLHVIKSYKGRKAVNILRMLDSSYLLFEQARPMVSGKLITLSLLTVFIWSAEVLALTFVIETMRDFDAIVTLVRQFVVMLEGGLRANTAGSGFVAAFESAKIQILVIAGFIALVFHCKSRIRTPRENY